MSVSLGPFITCFITIAFLTLYLYIILYRSGKHYIYGTKTVFIGIAVILLRMCIPVNLPFTCSIYSYKILPKATKPIYTVIGESGYMAFHIFLLCWVGIAIFRLFRLGIEKMHLHRLVKEYAVTDPDEYPNIFSSVAGCTSKPVKYPTASNGVFDPRGSRQMCMQACPLGSLLAEINIAVVPYHISPSITGLLHPTLLFPVRCEALPREDLDYICMHEITHYENHDLWVKLLMEIVSCIHWWNPFVYQLKQEYSLALELANDHHLINACSNFNHTDYARLLVETAKSISHSRRGVPGGAISFAREKKSDLSTRIDFILKEPSQKKSRNKIINIHAVIIGMVMVFSLLFVFEPSSRIPPIAEDGTFEMNPENTYLIQTSDGYEIYIEDKYATTILELPEDFKNYEIYRKGDLSK